jgi:tetratricopeptide (TPR) repeat protein
MQRLWAGFWLLCIPILARADSPKLQEARQRWLHGNYEEARALFETLAKDAKEQVAAVYGLSRTLQTQGEYDKALEVLDTALANHPSAAELHARRAELLYLRGRWDDALSAVEKALAIKPENFLARWVRGQIASDRADLTRADAEFRWFVRTYSERSNKDDDIKDPDELLLVGLAGAENARWHNLSDQFQVILRDVYGDALKADKGFWLAEYQAGILLLEKYNRGEALDAFAKALTINPNAAEALVGKAQAALQKYEIRDAEQLVERALKINRNLPEALRLRADIHLLAGDLEAASRALECARRINPRSEATLGRIAACYKLGLHPPKENFYVRGDQRAFDALCEEVRQFDPKPGVFYHELAAQLEERKRFEEAEKYYKKAIELRPMLPWPHNGLGLLYMRLGREKEAEEVLSKAFKADEFNVRVSNTLKVLRHLAKYQTVKTEHFLLRFDPGIDRLLARFMAHSLEEIYANLADKFHYHPPAPILIEVFNNHDMFSGRIVALPDLPTFGASTGRIVAMVSPYSKEVRQPFNWARVLRHELVHIFNLEQTHFQCPHWLTEGLAVSYEGFPRPQSWNQLLRQRVAADELMNLDNIDLGFIRPRSPLDWNMAYCQSQLYVDFLKDKYGHQVIGELLNAYREGLDTATAVTKVCRVDKKTFEQGYRDYLAVVVKSLQGRPADKPLTYTQLQRAHEADPNDLAITARLAEQSLVRRDYSEARKLADAVLAKQAAQPLALYVKARLLQNAGDDDAAKKLLETAVDKGQPEPKVLQALGKLYFEAQDFAKAAEIYELAHRAEPYDSKWLVELARVYTQLGDNAKRIETLMKLVPTDADDLDQRKRLAQLLLGAERFAEAERFARQALEIDVRDLEVREFLEKALQGQNKTKELEQLRQLLAQ